MEKNKTLDYELKRSRRTTLAIEITRQGQIIVRAPQRLAAHKIQSFVVSKQAWLEKHLAQCEPSTQPQFQTGDEFWYLGQRYPLQLQTQVKALLQFDNQIFYLAQDYQAQAKQLLQAWYVRQAKKILPARCAAFAAQQTIQYKNIKINHAKTRWGSCSSNGNINLAWRLIMTPPAVIDYVIAHELAHLQEMNHSSRFWQIVATLYPDYATQKQWLRMHERELIW